MNNVAAVIVTYNRNDLLRQCVENVLSQGIDIDLVVVDNAGNEETEKMLREIRDDVTYVRMSTNQGSAGGFNRGMRVAVEAGYEYLWLMDDDTMPQPGALAALQKAASKLKGKYGFLASRVVWRDGSPCKMSIPRITKWKKLKDFDHFCSVEYASFTSLYIKAETVVKYGLPYKEFFLWGEDWEYTRRISKHEKGYYVPGSIIKHECEDNNGASIVSADASNLDRHRIFYRNRVVIYRQDKFDGLFYLFVRSLWHTGRVFMKSDNKIKKIKLMSDSIEEGKRFFPKIEYVGNNDDNQK